MKQFENLLVYTEPLLFSEKTKVIGPLAFRHKHTYLRGVAIYEPSFHFHFCMGTKLVLGQIQSQQLTSSHQTQEKQTNLGKMGTNSSGGGVGRETFTMSSFIC